LHEDLIHLICPHRCLFFKVQQEWYQCVQNGEVFIIEHGLFARPEPRLVEGVEFLATVLRHESPLPPGNLDTWKDKVLKYQYQSKGNDSVLHYTAELSARFTPFFPSEKLLQPILLSRNNNNISLRESNIRETQNGSPVWKQLHILL
jgi:hypothetical protein